jgi:hypothetical protein
VKGITKAVVGARNSMAITAATEGTLLITLYCISYEKMTRHENPMI